MNEVSMKPLSNPTDFSPALAPVKCPMGSYFRLFFLTLAAAYLVFAAAVQYNDPDPLHWMALYALTAICCLGAIAEKYWPWLLWMLLGMSVTEMLIALDGFRQWLALGGQNLLSQQMAAEKPWIEQSREFLGAGINLGIVVYLLRRQVRAKGILSENEID